METLMRYLLRTVAVVAVVFAAANLLIGDHPNLWDYIGTQAAAISNNDQRIMTFQMTYAALAMALWQLAIGALIALLILWYQTEKAAKWRRLYGELKQARVELKGAVQKGSWLKDLLDRAANTEPVADDVLDLAERSAKAALARLAACKTSLEGEEVARRTIALLSKQNEAIEALRAYRAGPAYRALSEVRDRSEELDAALGKVESIDGDEIDNVLYGLEEKLAEYQQRYATIKDAPAKLGEVMKQLEALEKAVEDINGSDELVDLVGEIKEKQEELDKALEAISEGNSYYSGDLSDQIESIHDAQKENAEKIMRLHEIVQKLSDLVRSFGAPAQA